MSARPDWDPYFLGIAEAVAARATCPRKHVGALIVRDRHILATGYNGSLPGQPHCEAEGVGCLMEDGHCVRTLHAETNAILQARESLRCATLYTTASPCWPCFRLAAGVGVVRVVFGEVYRADDPGPQRVIKIAKSAKIELVNPIEELTR